MGWDQEYYVESVSSFLQRLVGIEEDFIAKEVRRRMEEKGLEIAKVEEIEELGDFYPAGKRLRVTLSNGQVFIHKCVHTESSDDWGRDDYELRPEDEDTETTHNCYC